MFTGVSSGVDTNPGRYAMNCRPRRSVAHLIGTVRECPRGAGASGAGSAPPLRSAPSRWPARGWPGRPGAARGQGPRRWTLGPRSYRLRARAVQAAGPASVLPPVARAPHRARDDGPPSVAVEPEPSVEAGAQTFGVVEGVHLDAVVGEPPPPPGCWFPAGEMGAQGPVLRRRRRGLCSRCSRCPSRGSHAG